MTKVAEKEDTIKTEKLTAGASTNPTAAAPAGPKLKPETEAQAKMWIENGMKLDPTTNVVDTPTEAVETMLKENKLPSRAELQQIHAGLHQLTASQTLASGQIAQDHWSTQKAEERNPVMAPMTFWDGQSTTATHVPHSVERVPNKSETVVVPHQVNMSSQTNVGRNVGQMSAVRHQLRRQAAENLK